MNQPALKIDELRLCVSGLNPRDAQRFAEQMVQQLAAQLPGSMAPQHIGALHVRLPSTAAASSELPGVVARALARRIS